MDVFNKFIIETDEELGDCLIIGRVTYHNQLSWDEDKVKSGGWWSREGDRITFYGESHQYGKATQEQVTEAVMNNKVFTGYVLEHPINNKHIFFYTTQAGDVEIKQYHDKTRNT